MRLGSSGSIHRSGFPDGTAEAEAMRAAQPDWDGLREATGSPPSTSPGWLAGEVVPARGGGSGQAPKPS